MKIHIRYAFLKNQTKSDLITIKNHDILVKELKERLEDKYGIPHSNQRLTYKIANEFNVMLTNDLPLGFFHVKDGGTIQLDLVGVDLDELNNQTVSLTKKKYLSSLGFFSQGGSQLMDNTSIQGTDNISIHTEKTSSIDELLSAIKSNDQELVKSIIKDCKTTNLNQLGENGWGALHTAAFYGLNEITNYLISKDVNVNLLNKEGWSALHLACYKGNSEVVKSLITAPDIDVNIVTKDIGTALHVACKRNQVKTVSIMLVKTNISIE